jgi:hypothetical protein
MIIGFGNNTAAALASDITAGQTSFSVIPGAGENFAKLLTTEVSTPNSPHKVYAKLTLTDSQQTVFEICHLTAVSNDTLTVIRGQEGTTAKGWALNDVIANYATRGSEQAFVQIEQLQAGDYTAATAGGTPNALTISIPSTFQNNSSNDWVLKVPLLVTPIAANSGSATLQITLAGKVLGIFPLYKGNKSPLDAGDLITGIPACCVLDQSKSFFNVINPAAAYFGKVRTVNSKAPDNNGNVTITSPDIFNGQAIAIPDAADLNTYTTPGLYYQNANAQAASGKNYPEANAGTLEIYKNAGTTQVYRTYSSSRTYSRSLYGGSWSKWGKVYDTENKPTPAEIGAVAKAGDTMTGRLTANSDGSAIMLKPVTAGSASFLISQDSSGVNNWYIGYGSNNANTLNVTNYKTGSAMSFADTIAMSKSLAVSGTVTPSQYTNFDARYVSSCRLSAVTWTPSIQNDRYNLTGGSVLTGVFAGANYAVNMSFAYRSMQYMINGTWYTAASI